jgi:hypothetical protein
MRNSPLYLLEIHLPKTSNTERFLKPTIRGYHSLKTIYNGADKKLKGRVVEFLFEDKGKNGTTFHFIKFI